MRVFILTLGTRGDFEPFWALGRALAARGHAVTLGTSSFHVQDDRAVKWVTIGQGTLAEFKRFLASLGSQPDRNSRSLAFGRQWAMPQVYQSEQVVTSVAAEHDYFICNMKFPLMRDGQVIPGALVTYDPPQQFEELRRYGSHTHQGRTLELVAMNCALIDPDGIWGADFHFTGFWDVSHLPTHAIGEAVPVASDDAPPVVLTMGSMLMFDAPTLVNRFAQALQQVGRRGVVVGGWTDRTAPQNASERLRFVDEADYRELFPRAACVIHHGGVGTVAAVLRAGVPSILLPQIASQERWGRILQREQLCADVFLSEELDVPQLTDALRRACEDPQIKHAAARWKERVVQDQGLPAAVSRIEDHWASLS